MPSQSKMTALSLDLSIRQQTNRPGYLIEGLVERKMLVDSESMREVIVAIESEIIEARGDSEPSGHVRLFDATYAGFRGDHYVPIAKRPADQNDVQLHERPDYKRFRTKEINARGTHVASDQGYRKLLFDSRNAAKFQRKFERRTRTLSFFQVHANSVSRNTHEAAWMRRTQEWHDAKSRGLRGRRSRMHVCISGGVSG